MTGSASAPVANPFESMPGSDFGIAATRGLAYSFGKPFSQQKFPGLVKYVQEAEILVSINYSCRIR